MLNFGLKKEALQRLETKAQEYQELATKVEGETKSLNELRRSTGVQVISSVESYMSGLANRPIEFDKSFSEFRVSFDRFVQAVWNIKAEAVLTNVKSGVMAGASIGLGVATTAVAPAAAMSLATAVGTASTGTAISTLSGAAAVNAATAWLGGGAISAGGGGMALGGNVLIALSGPVGWAIGGVALVGTGIWTHSANEKVATEAHQKADEIVAKICSIEATRTAIKRIEKRTREHTNGVHQHVRRLSQTAPSDYNKFSAEQRKELGALKNEIESLSKLLHEQMP